jgi:hypothetical protein
MRSYLGTHQPGWLSQFEVPMFVSDRRLRDYVTLPRALGEWALDSGGFSELSMHGSWDEGPTPQEYARRVERYARVVGNLQWAAPQDWMCEDLIIAKTGLDVLEHQYRTIENLDALRSFDPTLLPAMPRFIPVVQGKRVDEYVRHAGMYKAAGIDLTTEPLVGVGSVCRRQGTEEAKKIFEALHAAGVTRLHGFGLKKTGLALYGHLLTSADSMAWSYDARRSAPMGECIGHKNCANCPRFALQWRRELLTKIGATAA